MNDIKMESVTNNLALKSWVGESTFIQITKQRLRSMAKSQLPVLIIGEIGTGKEIAARMLHDCSVTMAAPFISVCCQSLNQKQLITQIEESLFAAEGGSLYIKNIDVLAGENASFLKGLWQRADASVVKIRLIASSSNTRMTDAELVDSGNGCLGEHFLSWLHYHCLNIELPTLANREQDINALVQAYQLSDANIAKLSFQPCAWDVLKGYSWPENAKQLKRCLDKLAVQGESSIINREVLVNCFPSMRQPLPLNGRSIDAIQRREVVIKPYLKVDNQRVFTTAPALSVNHKQDLVALSKGEKAVNQAKNHPGLNKAITYLYKNFKTPLTMEELARHACMSPSHLSYLFKHYLGMSFKQILLRLRIVKAMEILSKNPHRHVTQVCDDVGFSDLSFFVRKFKTTVGVSPGAYRDQFSQSESSPELLALVDDLAHPLLQLQN
ncbi:helix-turn-helix domain-containing protein [Shewanella abyssi]|uniref:helix-turn-helix domain-containing protein n=1 Tax=Shewanella abyssi TaxID=311789 RepID=UPI00200EF042|nr:helix-turn-helix domain-containing protein [Shewanella abyssi]MCL1051849.1 helix-turn-helix domain-containing protein [Shewanella abyssi]